MALYEIPITPWPRLEQEVELDGVVYLIELAWLDRDDAWHLTLSSVDGDLIRAGIRVVPNWPLLRKVRHRKRPPGELLVLDSLGDGVRYDNLGTAVTLMYADAAELAGGPW